jgi:WD40 repeat protein
LLTACADGSARIWPADTGKPWVLTPGPDDALQAAAWRSDGRRVATLSRKGVLSTWDTSDLPAGGVETPVPLSDQASLMTWQPNGTALAAVRGFDVLVYDGDSGVLLCTLTGHRNLIRSCAWSPSGQLLVTTCRDAVLRIWKVGSGALVEAADHAPGSKKLGLASWSPDGRYLAYSSELPPDFGAVPAGGLPSSLSAIRILSASSFDLLHELRGHANAVRILSWHPGGSLLASISNDRAIVWDVLLGQQKFGVEQAALSVIDTAYSPDGSALWTSGEDRVVRLWDAESGRERRRSAGHGGRVTSVAWHPDSTSVAIARSDGVALVVRADELPEIPEITR